jgi:hypothetical protein
VSRRIERSGAGAWLAGLGACLCAGCVDTDAGMSALLPICAATSPAAPPFSSLVYVRSDLNDHTIIECSGVVIAPTLVLTDLRCVVLPPEVDPEVLDSQSEAESGPPGFQELDANFTGTVDYAASCYSETGWAPQEDGSFSARLSAPLDASRVTVAIMGEQGKTTSSSSVNRLLVARAESRCWDTLAVLVLDHDLGLSPATLRLENTSQPGDAVTLSGFGLVRGYFTPHELPTQIENVTQENGSFSTPPRSLLLTEPVCDYEMGGMVVANDSNALVGVIGFETDYTCQDPAAKTIATTIAPFRRLLLDAAQLTSQTLRVEPLRISAAALMQACPADP